jgi:hypothetical protein
MKEEETGVRNRKETKPRIGVGSSKGRHRQGNLTKKAKKSDGEWNRKKKGTRRRK